MTTAHLGASLTEKAFRSWLTYGGSGDSDLNPELPKLRERSRDLIRNNGIASGAIQTLTDNVIGPGLRLVVSPDYKALNKDKKWSNEWSRQVESLWREWAESTECDVTRSLTFNGLTTQIYRSSIINGEALALVLWLKNREVHTVFQLVESDRLSNPEGKMDNERLRGGIEINKYGTPIAYYILKNHPGDALYSGFNTWQRIPARMTFGRPRILHVHDKERTGQSRGKPLFSSIIPLFKLLDQYVNSEVKGSIVASMLAAFIETPMDREALEQMFSNEEGKKGEMESRKNWNLRLQPGSILPLFPGDKVTPFTPTRPNSSYAAFVENLLRNIGIGMNLPYELLMKDFSKTNYSSARASLLESWRYFAGRREWVTTYWAKPVYKLWLEEMVNKGFIKAEGFYERRGAWSRSRWIGPGRGAIDPVKEAQASVIKIDNGLSTLETETSLLQGERWDDNMEQRKTEKDKEEELGIRLETSEEIITEKNDENDENNENDESDESDENKK